METSANMDLSSAGTAKSIRSVIMPSIELIGVILLVVLVFIQVSAVVFRYILNSPLTYGDELASLLFLWTAMIGSAIAIDRNEHVRLTLFISMMSARSRSLIEALSLTVILAFLAYLIPLSVEHAISEYIIESPALGISNSWRAAALAFGLMLMLLFILDRLFSEHTKIRAILSIIAVGSLLYALYFSKSYIVSLGYMNIVIFLIGVLFVGLLIGMPIAFCFGSAALSFLVFSTNIPSVVMIGRLDEGMSSLILLAVPLFILLGCILDSTGMGKSIVEFLASLFGHVRSGMSYVLLGSIYLVSGISGSKIADMATVAPALFPEMKRRGNNPPEMAALLGTGAVMADTVPPSIILIVLGSVAGLSIAQLFTSGFVVAFFLMIILAVLARWKSTGDQVLGAKASWSESRAKFLAAFPALTLPVIIRVLVGEGIATATEVSAIAVIYAIIIGIWLYQGLNAKRLYQAAVETVSLSGAILIIMGTALAAAWALTQTGFASALASFMTTLPGGSLSFLLISIIAFILLGALLEGLPALVLMAPLMFPVAHQLGINEIHYAMVVVVALSIGLFMPPIGIGFYLTCSIGKVKPDFDTMVEFWKYLFALLLGLIVIALFPAISIGYL